MNSYHDTAAHVKSLEVMEQKCTKQEERVLFIFKKYPTHLFTWREISRGHKYHFQMDIEGVSCKRAITNLCNKGLIEKMDKAYGKYDDISKVTLSTWKYNSK